MELKKIMLLLVQLAVTVGFAQEIKVHYNAAIASGLQLKSNEVNIAKNYGGEIGASYSYELKPNLGVSGGLAYNFIKGELATFEDTFKSNEIDGVGEGFELETYVGNCRESVSLHNIVIPVQFYYDTAKTKKSTVGFYASVGLKLCIPIQQNTVVKIDDLETKGYYPSDDSTLSAIEKHGFGKWESFEEKGNSLNSGISVVATGEIGASFNYLGGLYLGTFIDCGLSNLKNEGKGSLVKYNPKGRPKEASGLLGLKEVEKLAILSYGLQVKIKVM